MKQEKYGQKTLGQYICGVNWNSKPHSTFSSSPLFFLSSLLLFCPPTSRRLPHGTSLPYLGMFVYGFAGLTLVAATLLRLSMTAEAGCSNPSVRREWRTLAPHERAEWIAAVKVRHRLSALLTSLTLPFQCLNELPHNPSLVPTLNTTYSAIPPINETSSYFDGSFIPHFLPDTAYFILE